MTIKEIFRNVILIIHYVNIRFMKKLVVLLKIEQLSFVNKRVSH